VVSATSDIEAPPATMTRPPLAVTGGHAAAHAPVQADVVPLSASNAYTVKPLPVVRIVPSAVCRSVSALLPAAPAPPAGGGVGAGGHGAPPPGGKAPPAAPAPPAAAPATTASGLPQRPSARSGPTGLIIVATSFLPSRFRASDRVGQTG